MQDDTTGITEDRLSITLPGMLIAQMDAHIGPEFVDREESIRAAIRYCLDYLRQARSAHPGEG